MAKRIRIHKPGSWDQLKIEDFDCPSPEAGSIKVDVAAAGINFADVIVRQGLYSSAKEYVGWPITPGFEIAGTVIEVGENVQDFHIGDRVMAVTFFGGYSSQVVVQAAYARTIPQDLSFTEAAGIPVTFMTSYYAACWTTRLHKDSVALVHSAAGGVGLSLMQILKEAGCRVIGVVGTTAKVDITQHYGADAVIDKSKADVWTDAEALADGGYDLIFDPNGVSTVKQSYKHLAPGGLLFVYGFQSMLSKNRGHQSFVSLASSYIQTPRLDLFDMVKTNRSVIAFNISYLYGRADIMAEAFDYIAAGFDSEALKVLPTATYDFHDVATAHKNIESGKTTGKLVLTF